MSLNVAVFGLGSMGYGMALSCMEAGLNVHGFDVMAQHVARFIAEGGKNGDVAEVAPTLDAVVVVVLNAAQTESVLFGDDGVVPRLRAGDEEAQAQLLRWATGSIAERGDATRAMRDSIDGTPEFADRVRAALAAEWERELGGSATPTILRSILTALGAVPGEETGRYLLERAREIQRFNADNLAPGAEVARVQAGDDVTPGRGGGRQGGVVGHGVLARRKVVHPRSQRPRVRPPAGAGVAWRSAAQASMIARSRHRLHSEGTARC